MEEDQFKNIVPATFVLPPSTMPFEPVQELPAPEAVALSMAEPKKLNAENVASPSPLSTDSVPAISPMPLMQPSPHSAALAAHLNMLALPELTAFYAASTMLPFMTSVMPAAPALQAAAPATESPVVPQTPTPSPSLPSVQQKAVPADDRDATYAEESPSAPAAEERAPLAKPAPLAASISTGSPSLAAPNALVVSGSVAPSAVSAEPDDHEALAAHSLAASTSAVKAESQQQSDDEEESVTRCICGDNDDIEGFMIYCEGCHVWQHGQCVGVTTDNTPENYYCEKCEPDDPVHQRRAVLKGRPKKGSKPKQKTMKVEKESRLFGKEATPAKKGPKSKRKRSDDGADEDDAPTKATPKSFLKRAKAEARRENTDVERDGAADPGSPTRQPLSREERKMQRLMETFARLEKDRDGAPPETKEEKPPRKTPTTPKIISMSPSTPTPVGVGSALAGLVGSKDGSAPPLVLDEAEEPPPAPVVRTGRGKRGGRGRGRGSSAAGRGAAAAAAAAATAAAASLPAIDEYSTQTPSRLSRASKTMASANITSQLNPAKSPLRRAREAPAGWTLPAAPAGLSPRRSDDGDQLLRQRLCFLDEELAVRPSNPPSTPTYLGKKQWLLKHWDQECKSRSTSALPASVSSPQDAESQCSDAPMACKSDSSLTGTASAPLPESSPPSTHTALANAALAELAREGDVHDLQLSLASLADHIRLGRDFALPALSRACNHLLPLKKLMLLNYVQGLAAKALLAASNASF